MQKKCKIIVLVDGHNLYHGIDDLCKKFTSPQSHHLKWISLYDLAKQFMSPKTDEIEKVRYFTAYLNFKNQEEAIEKLKRHKKYSAVLKHEGTEEVLGKFKKKDRYCPKCNTNHKTVEEKQTDVNIAVHIIRLAYERKYDKLFLITGDTDIIPAIKAAKEVYPEGRIELLMPPKRVSGELKEHADNSRAIKLRHLKAALLPEEITLANGKTITRPPKYDPPSG